MKDSSDHLIIYLTRLNFTSAGESSLLREALLPVIYIAMMGYTALDIISVFLPRGN